MVSVACTAPSLVCQTSVASVVHTYARILAANRCANDVSPGSGRCPAPHPNSATGRPATKRLSRHTRSADSSGPVSPSGHRARPCGVTCMPTTCTPGRSEANAIAAYAAASSAGPKTINGAGLASRVSSAGGSAGNGSRPSERNKVHRGPSSMSVRASTFTPERRTSATDSPGTTMWSLPSTTNIWPRSGDTCANPSDLVHAG